MSTNVTWNGVTYSIPAAGEVGWSALSNFLVALGNNAAISEEMKQALRVATTSPVTVSDTTDCVVVTDLGTPGAVAVNLPAGSAGRFFFVIDGKGDAGTNNITITPNGAQTIGGAASLVLSHNRDAVLLVYSATGTDWKVFGPVTREGSLVLNNISGTLSIAKGGTGQTTANAALNALLPSQTGNSGKALITDGTNAAWTAVASTDTLTPVGSIVAYNPGYYTGGSNSGFTVTGPATNTVAGVNAYLPANWRVCDGTALNDAGSPIWVGAGRFLPDLTDSRFLMGSTAAGSTGGSSTMAHTHSVTSNVTVATQPTFTVNSHTHTISHVHAVFHANQVGGTTKQTELYGRASQSTSSTGISTSDTKWQTYNSIAQGASTVETLAQQASGTSSYYSSGVSLVAGTGASGTGDTATSGTASASGTTRTADVALTNNAVTSGAASNTENRPLYLSTFYIVRVK